MIDPKPISRTAQRITERLAVYLGEHTARVAVKSFAERTVGHGSDLLEPRDVPALLNALRPMLWINAVGVRNGTPDAIPDLFAGLCDLACFCLIAPVLLTALAFRGGVLYFPWALLAASEIAWLVFDSMDTLGDRVPLAPATALTVAEIFRALACTYACAAGLAQRAVVTHSPEESVAEVA